jgi:hypothetical protein
MRLFAVFSVVVAGLNSNATLSDIGAALGRFCQIAPKPLVSVCVKAEQSFVRLLGKLPATLNLQDYTPYTLCTMLSECKVDCCVSDLPEQIKLTLTDNADEIAVNWISRNKPQQPCVRYGLSPASTQLACGTSDTYTVGGWVGWLQTVVVSGLQPRSTYTYVVGDSAAGGHWSPTAYTFQNGPFLDEAANRPFRFAVIGDMGDTDQSNGTITHLLNLVQSDGYDVLLHDGDIAYADGVQLIFDNYGRSKVEKLNAFKPVLYTIGNHEAIFYDGLPYRKRFNHPTSSSPDPIYWSADIELTHVIGLNSESNVDTAYISDAQIAWLRTDLAAVNRTKTPWIVVLIHRPLYCTSELAGTDCGTFARLLRTAVESLFVAYDVDLVIQAHRHNYESSYPVAYGKVTRNKSPVYVVNGSAGSREGITGGFTNPAPAWSRFRSLDYGYGLLSIHNASSLVWTFHRDTDNKIVDSLTITK